MVLEIGDIGSVLAVVFGCASGVIGGVSTFSLLVVCGALLMMDGEDSDGSESCKGDGRLLSGVAGRGANG